MLQNIPKEKILEVVREGPTMPQKIVKRVGGDTMLVGAILSTMINSGDVKISTLKIGGSPLYYVPGDEEKLEGFIDHLNDKDKKIFKLLKEKKLLKDSEQDPLTRVSLRALKDFAKSFEAEVEGKKELYWRYYLYDVEEARAAASESIKPAKITIIETPSEVLSPKEIHPEKIEKAVEKLEEIEKDMEEKKSAASESQVTALETHPKIKSERKHEKHELEEKPDKSEKQDKPDFYERVKEHVHRLNLDIINKEKIKKSEYYLVLKNHDANEYIYCVAKDKKAINEGDLSTAFVFAHNKRMPCMFIMTGHLSKKAEHMTEKEFKDMKIEKI